MSVVQRSALEASPLADLHTLAGALNIDGYRRLRKADLVGAIIDRQGADESAPAAASANGDEAGSEATKPPRRARRRRAVNTDEEQESAARDDEPGSDGPTRGSTAAEETPARGRSARPRRAATPAATKAKTTTTSTSETTSGSERGATDDAAGGETVKGVVELLPNGSGFLRVAPAPAEGGSPAPSDDDVYISAAQARRCELVAGDQVSGPARPARRSERHPSLIRVELINGVAADEAVSGTRIDELDLDFPSQPIALGEDDPTLAAIEFFAPFGRGSRVLVHGPARSGKSEAIKRLAGVLAKIEGLQVEVLLVGIRPEELGEWKASTIASVSGHSFAAAAGAQGGAIEQAVERGKRIAARGGDAVLLIDTLDGAEPAVARRALAAARNLRASGSLTIIATAAQPYGGETTVVSLDRDRAASGKLPAVDPLQSGTVRAELLVGLERFQAIAEARAEH